PDDAAHRLAIRGVVGVTLGEDQERACGSHACDRRQPGAADPSALVLTCGSTRATIAAVAETNVQALLDGVAAALDAPVALDDVQFRLLAHTAQGALIDDVRRSWIVDRRLPDDVREFLDRQGVQDAEGPVRTPAEPSIGATFPRWCVPVR